MFIGNCDDVFAAVGAFIPVSCQMHFNLVVLVICVETVSLLWVGGVSTAVLTHRGCVYHGLCSIKCVTNESPRSAS